ncbi:MAG: NTP transferase domain-containing protein [Desulfobacteraceae bacterium]
MKREINGMAAVIPAAGLSSRMQRFKPLLWLNGKTILESAMEGFREAGISRLFVVTGHRAEELEPLIRRAEATPVYNPHYRRGMFSSICAGISRLPQELPGFFVLPVDIPLVRPATIRSLASAFERRDLDILHPVYKTTRGHPPVIAMTLKQKILTWNSGGGLKACLDQFQDSTEEMAVPDRGILMDGDTQGDYEKLLARKTFYRLPSPDECMELLETIHPADRKIIRHCRAVEQTAAALARAVSKGNTPRSASLNCDLVSAGALLHDIAKGRKDHAEKGAVLIKKWGFPGVAHVIAAHTDISTAFGTPLNEKEIVYLADKITRGTRVDIGYDERFREKAARFGHDPEAAKAISRRWSHADIIRNKIQRAAGLPLETLLESEK